MPLALLLFFSCFAFFFFLCLLFSLFFVFVSFAFSSFALLSHSFSLGRSFCRCLFVFFVLFFSSCCLTPLN